MGKVPPLRLREHLDRRGWSPRDLARYARLPIREVVPLLGEPPPRFLRLAVLHRIAYVLDIEPGDLFGLPGGGVTASVSVSVSDTSTDRPDDLRDLEDAWAADFPDDARRDPEAVRRWPRLFV